MKKILTLICAVMMSLAANAQVLYKISGNGLKKTSYVIGTVHVMKGSFVDSIPGANRVLSEVEQVCGELDMQYISNQDTALVLAQMLMLPADSAANKVLTEEELDKLCRVVNENYNIDLKNPQFASLLQFYPLMMMLTVGQLSEMMKLQQAMAEGKATETPEPIMDIYLQQKAQGMSKPVIGLESYTFQVKLLTSLFEMPIREQYLGMIESFQKKEDGVKIVQGIVDAYKTFNLDRISQTLKASDGFENVANRVFDSRNENWAQKMPSIMSEKSTLFAVGAGHLVGDKGILNLLKKQGYKVKAVKK
jgi:hypothetical protein